jgi:hypothetical protein
MTELRHTKQVTRRAIALYAVVFGVSALFLIATRSGVADEPVDTGLSDGRLDGPGMDDLIAMGEDRFPEDEPLASRWVETARGTASLQTVIGDDASGLRRSVSYQFTAMLESLSYSWTEGPYDLVPGTTVEPLLDVPREAGSTTWPRPT